MRYRAQEGTQAGLNSYCLPRIFLYLIAAAAIGLNAYTILNNLNESEGEGATRIGIVAAINKTATNANATNAIELQNSAIRATFDHGDAFFDCNHSQSKCEYFYPGKFFQHYFSTSILLQNNNDTKTKKSISIAAEQHQHEQYTEWGKKIGLENGNLPALDSLSWWTMDNDAPTAAVGDNRRDSNSNYNQLIQNHIHLPSNITYIHVHKCAGTSIQGALYKRARRIKKMQFRTNNEKQKSRTHAQYKQHLLQMNSDVHTYKHSFGGGSREKKAQRDESRVQHIQAIANFQAKYRNKQSATASASSLFPIFTVIRDPIQRFLSATQQVMHYNTDFRQKCLKEYKATIPSSILSSLVSSKSKEEREAPLRRQTIQCAIQDMKETTYRRDVHLLPIASHFRLLDNVTIPNSKDHGAVSRDVAVSVFYMKDVKDVLLHLVGDDDNKSRSNSSNAPTVYHARDRSNVEYATSSILAKLSSTDCSEEMIQQICALYDVDVALMRWLGFEGESTKMCT